MPEEGRREIPWFPLQIPIPWFPPCKHGFPPANPMVSPLQIPWFPPPPANSLLLVSLASRQFCLTAKIILLPQNPSCSSHQQPLLPAVKPGPGSSSLHLAWWRPAACSRETEKGGVASWQSWKAPHHHPKIITTTTTIIIKTTTNLHPL